MAISQFNESLAGIEAKPFKKGFAFNFTSTGTHLQPALPRQIRWAA